MITRSRSRGFSLIEALVALLVMGFGMLGVLGIQSALRQYSDISKQRTEAVRLAQEGTETWRAFIKLDADAGATDYTDISSHAATAVVGALAAATNTSYTMERQVVTLPTSADLPQSGKWVQTTLRWNDRTGTQQRVDFHTHISGISPDLAGTLLAPPAGGAGAVRRPQGRHPGIPRGALDDGTGKSTFTPPGLPSTTWTFDNITGLITKICNPGCTGSDFVAFLLSGYVQFSDPVDPPPGTFRQPTGADAETPYALGGSSTFGTIGVSVDQTAPASVAGTVVCATEAFPQVVAYYCALEATTAEKRWSGRSYITGPTFAADATDASASLPRSCRYTPQTADPAVPPLKNAEHPYDYAIVNESLFNQNFLMIRAGDGTAPFVCPGDDTTTPFVNGNTFRHQPAS